jgi:Flp pilus assembly protein protease CpaA
VIQSTENILLIALSAALIAAAIQDIRTRELSNTLCAIIGVLAVLRVLTGGITLLSSVSSLIVTGIPPYILWRKKKDTIGGGDVKILAVTGCSFGVYGADCFLCLSCFLIIFFNWLLKTIRKHDGLNCKIKDFAPVNAVLKVYRKYDRGLLDSYAPYFAASGIITIITMKWGLIH